MARERMPRVSAKAASIGTGLPKKTLEEITAMMTGNFHPEKKKAKEKKKRKKVTSSSKAKRPTKKPLRKAKKGATISGQKQTFGFDRPFYRAPKLEASFSDATGERRPETPFENLQEQDLHALSGRLSSEFVKPGQEVLWSKEGGAVLFRGTLEKTYSDPKTGIAYGILENGRTVPLQELEPATPSSPVKNEEGEVSEDREDSQEPQTAEVEVQAEAPQPPIPQRYRDQLDREQAPIELGIDQQAQEGVDHAKFAIKPGTDKAVAEDFGLKVERPSASEERKAKRKERIQRIHEAYVREGIMSEAEARRAVEGREAITTKEEAEQAAAQGVIDRKISAKKEERMKKVRAQVLLEEKDRESLVGIDRLALLNDRRAALVQEDVRYRTNTGIGLRLLQRMGFGPREPRELLMARRAYADVRRNMEEQLRDKAEQYFRESSLQKGKERDFERRYARLTAAQFTINEFEKLGQQTQSALGERASLAKRIWTTYAKQNRYVKTAAGSLILAAGSGASFAVGAAMVGRALLGAAVGRAAGEALAHGWANKRKYAEKLEKDIEHLKSQAIDSTLEERDELMKEVARKERRRQAVLTAIRAGTTIAAAGAASYVTNLGTTAVSTSVHSPSSGPEMQEAQHRIDQPDRPFTKQPLPKIERAPQFTEPNMPLRPGTAPIPESPVPEAPFQEYAPETPTPETPSPVPAPKNVPRFESPEVAPPPRLQTPEIPSPKFEQPEVPKGNLPPEVSPEAPRSIGVRIERGDSLWSTLAKAMHHSRELQDLSPGQRMLVADGLQKEISSAIERGDTARLASWGIKSEDVTDGINRGKLVGSTIDYSGIMKDGSLFEKYLTQARRLTPTQVGNLDVVASRLRYLR